MMAPLHEQERYFPARKRLFPCGLQKLLSNSDCCGLVVSALRQADDAFHAPMAIGVPGGEQPQYSIGIDDQPLEDAQTHHLR
jgi:hypothetical protein